MKAADGKQPLPRFHVIAIPRTENKQVAQSVGNAAKIARKEFDVKAGAPKSCLIIKKRFVFLHSWKLRYEEYCRNIKDTGDDDFRDLYVVDELMREMEYGM